MQPRHIALAVLLSIVWGLNFVVIAVALGGFPPMLLAAIRFMIAAIPVFFIARPAISWGLLVAISLTLFVGQYGLLFPAMMVGMPPGIASIVLQVQAFFTIAIAAAVLRERPTPQQLLGGGIALVGLAIVATTTGTGGITLLGLALAIGSAAAWACGNVLLRRAGRVDMTAMVAWSALIAIVPLLALSSLLEGPAQMSHALTHATWLTAGAVLYIGLLSTTFGFGVWTYLLKLYPAATVAPFSLLVPVSGTIFAAVLLHESFGFVRLAGMAFIMLGITVLVIRRRAPILA
jgi:O-acetylserine/cysteine efflux transporter